MTRRALAWTLSARRRRRVFAYRGSQGRRPNRKLRGASSRVARSNYLVSLVGISVLRHWSAWSGPPGRLFCKSNRRTALRWSSSALSSIYRRSAVSLAPSSHSRPSLLRATAAAILFGKKDSQAHFRSFVRCDREVRLSPAYDGAMANAPSGARGRKRKREEPRGYTGDEDNA